MALAPDSRTRLSIEQCETVSLEGEPTGATVSYASGAEPVEVEVEGGRLSLPLRTAPDLIEVAWDYSGVNVSATVEVVTTRYCTVQDVLNHRPDENLLDGVDDATIQAAIDRAEHVIEAEANRVFQPVLMRGVTDRPNCRTSSLVLLGEFTASDMRSVVSAKDQDGNPVNLRVCNPSLLDVRDFGVSKFAEVVVECGMKPTPPEVKSAVVSLAAWYLTDHAMPDNATSASTDLGFMRFVVGGVDGAATSIPEVNAVIERYGLQDFKVR